MERGDDIEAGAVSAACEERGRTALEVALANPCVPALDPASLAVPKGLLSAFERARRILVTPHVLPPPDGDGVGGALALTRALRAQGKRAELCVDDSMPGFLRNLDAHREARRARELSGPFDLVVLLDVGDAGRIGGAREFLKSAGAVMVLDHHQGGELERVEPALLPGKPFFEWRAPELDASCLQAGALVSRLERRGRSLSRGQWAALALPLLVGVYSDTGAFRHQGLESRSLKVFKYLLQKRLCQELEVVRDALRWELPTIALALLQEPPALPERAGAQLGREQLQELEGLLAAGVRVRCERDEQRGLGLCTVPDRYVEAVVSAARLEDRDVNRSDVLRQIKRMHAAELQRTLPLSATLIEDLRDGGRVSCQFRSWDEGVALAVASALGGGGHSRAAGATLRGGLAEVREKVLGAVREQLDGREGA